MADRSQGVPSTAANKAPTSNPPAKVPPTVVRRGDIFWVNLDPILGSEQAGERPCVVMSRDSIHAMRIAVIVPLTSKEKPPLAHRIRIPESEKIAGAGEKGLPGNSMALTHQVRVVSFDRLDTNRVARMSPAAIGAIESGLVHVLDLF